MSEIFTDERIENTLFLFYIDILSDKKDGDRSFRILQDDFKFECLLRNVNLKMQLKVRNIKDETARCVKILNMLILRYVIEAFEHCKGIRLDQLIEEKNKYGKPKLENRNYQFNLSDEEGVVMLAVGFNEDKKDFEVGVDLANPKDIKNFGIEKVDNFYRKDFRSIFSEEEIENLDKEIGILETAECLKLFSHVWALKESYCKYIGVGITAGMENFQFPNAKLVGKVEDNSTESIGIFELIFHNIETRKIGNVDALNASFELPNSDINVSVFTKYENVCLARIDGKQFIDYFT